MPKIGISDLKLRGSNVLRAIRTWGQNVLGMASMTVRRLKRSVPWPGLKKESRVIVLSRGRFGSSFNTTYAAAKLGYQVHVFCEEFPGRETRCADMWHRVDCRRDFDRAIDIARRIGPVGILLEGQHMLLPMQRYLAEELGLRSITELGVYTSTSKREFKVALDKGSVRHSVWQLLNTENKPNVPFPAVVKPAVGTGSTGVQLVRTESELLRFSDQLKEIGMDSGLRGEWLIESYVEGRQFDVEGVARDGMYFPLVIVEEMYEESPLYFPASWFLFNPPIEAEMQGLLLSTVYGALESLGVAQGAFHCEVRVDAKGETWIVDYANRMGYNLLVSQACGSSFSENYVSAMIDTEFSPPKLKPRVVLSYWLRQSREVPKYKALINSRPESVLHARLFPFERSGHMYFGTVNTVAEDFSALLEVLGAFDLIPESWVVRFACSA